MMDHLQRILLVIGSSAAVLALAWLYENEPAPTPSTAAPSAFPVAMVRMKVEQRPAGAENAPATAPSPSMPARAPAPWPGRNPGIAPQELSHGRRAVAQNFLREVTVVRDLRGGFVVQDVDAGSLYAAMGLRPGDRIFSVDTPATAGLDDASVDDAMKQQHVELQVYRSEGFVLLRHEL